MKKVLCIITAAVLIMASLCMPAIAADNVNVVIDISLYDVNITATTTAEGTMTAQLSGGTSFYGMYSNSEPTEDDGEYTYTFHFRLPDGANRAAATTGEYKIRLGNNVSAEKTFNFVTPGDRITFYNELNDKSANEIYSYLTVDRAAFVTVDTTEYSALTGNILNLVNGAIEEFGTTYADIAPGDAVTLATVETNFKGVFTEAMTIAKMAIVTEEEWEDFADDMIEATTFDGKYYVDTTEEALLELINVFPYYKREIEEITVLEAVEYAKAFDRATLHLIEECADYETFKNAFLYIEDKGVITPDMTNINALVNAGKDTDLWKNVMADSNANCGALVSNAVAEAQSLVESGILNPPAGGGGGGAGGSSSIDKPSLPGGGGLSSGGDATPIVPVTPPQTTGTFSDVADSHWANEAIEALAEKGVLNGKGDGKFAPDDGVTREEFVKIIVVAFDLMEDADHSFTDVSEESWSYDYVASAAHHGIVTGDGNAFNPKSVITRQEMAVIIHRVFKLLEAEVSGESITFDDSSDIADYAKEAVEALTGAGILNGMGDGTFAPAGTVTRAQSAKVVYELLDLLGGGK